MFVRRLMSAAAVAVLALVPAACDKFGAMKGTSRATAAAPTTAESAPVSIGNPLYPSDDSVRMTRNTAATGNDPIVIPGAQITIPSTENVPTKNNGKLWQICTEWTPGTPEKDTFVHPADPAKKFRRLREGDIVQPRQLVALLDDTVALAKYKAAVTDMAASEKKLSASQTVTEKTFQTFNITKASGPSASKIDLYKAEQEWALAVKAAAEAEGERDKAREAANIAKVQLEEHELRATIGGEIRAIFRKPGESVKELEPVLQIQNLETFRVEGAMPAQDLPRLPPGNARVFLEPSGQLAPKQEFLGHGLAITGVGVTKDKKLIVSASEDKTVRVWDQTTKYQKAMFIHEVPVRALAVTGPKSSKSLALSGADDGFGRVYDLDDLNPEKVRKLKVQHKGRINAVAFSPDGSFCVTADDKEIFIFDLNNDERRYVIHTDHRGPIQQLQFTSQSKLVSTARDRTLRVFELGDKGAKLETIVDNRGGNVDHVGVSADGQRVIYDQERTLMVRGIYDGRTDVVMNSPSESSQFTGFAIFSPDASLVIAAGTGDNPLGVWKMPTGNSSRAYQRVRLAVSGSTPSCAAFAPDGSFAVVGTTDHRLLLFGRPEKTDLDREYPATIMWVNRSFASSKREVSVWAELPNPGMPLLPGDTVTIVVPVQ
ncbi:MAG: hypothetical protein ACJ8C4_19265 [Gemmataceae bacterium]